MVFIIVVGGTSFAWVESLFSNEDLGTRASLYPRVGYCLEFRVLPLKLIDPPNKS